MEDRVGQQLGNYRLVRLLGRGGFAEVYLGEHVRLGTSAAVKVLQIAAQHAIVPPPSLREKVPAITPDVEHVVLTTLAKDPKHRFGSIQAFATALEQASRSTG